MKTLILLLFPICSFAQIGEYQVYNILKKDSTSTKTIKTEARITAESALLSLGITGEFTQPESNYDVSIYSGEATEVLDLIKTDTQYYADAKKVFVYTGWDYLSDWTVVLIYKL